MQNSKLVLVLTLQGQLGILVEGVSVHDWASIGQYRTICLATVILVFTFQLFGFLASFFFGAV